jgi:hypothetical protein
MASAALDISLTSIVTLAQKLSLFLNWLASLGTFLLFPPMWCVRTAIATTVRML